MNHVEFNDGYVKEDSANTIVESILARVDSDGFLVSLLEAITYYKNDDPAVKMANNHLITSMGRKRLRMATQNGILKFSGSMARKLGFH